MEASCDRPRAAPLNTHGDSQLATHSVSGTMSVTGDSIHLPSYPHFLEEEIELTYLRSHLIRAEIHPQGPVPPALTTGLHCLQFTPLPETLAILGFRPQVQQHLLTLCNHGVGVMTPQDPGLRPGSEYTLNK